MAASFQLEREEEVVVAEKVLRRAQVSKVDICLLTLARHQDGG